MLYNFKLNTIFLINIMNTKQKYGQFFTTNYNYITDGMIYKNNINIFINHNIIEPFAGNKDMLNLVKDIDCNIECYDIDPKKNDIIKKDTLLNPPNYKNKFIITNPPYLARNKCNDKSIFDFYNQNDLYKCFIDSIIHDNIPNGGIIIIPLNFWCSIRKNDIELRKKFINKFNIDRVNIFEERVFADTSYTVCSILFHKKSTDIEKKLHIHIIIYPYKKEYLFLLNSKNNYTIGGHIYNLKQSKKIKINRLTSKNKDSKNITNIKLYALDSNSKKKIRLEMVSDKNRFIDETKKLSERSFATLIITPNLSITDQKILVINFNIYFNEMREKYNSLFLSNYRESSDIARKRISFLLVYKILNYLILVRPSNNLH